MKSCNTRYYDKFRKQSCTVDVGMVLDGCAVPAASIYGLGPTIADIQAALLEVGDSLRAAGSALQTSLTPPSSLAPPPFESANVGNAFRPQPPPIAPDTAPTARTMVPPPHNVSASAPVDDDDEDDEDGNSTISTPRSPSSATFDSFTRRDDAVDIMSPLVSCSLRSAAFAENQSISSAAQSPLAAAASASLPPRVPVAFGAKEKTLSPPTAGNPFSVFKRINDMRAILSQCEELFHEWAAGATLIISEEGEAHLRLNQSFLDVAQQVERYKLYTQYDRFVVFCIGQEPVWRRAAREIQTRQEERLNSTENLYDRIRLEDMAVAEKHSIFQEASDFLFSLRVYQQERQRQRYLRSKSRNSSSLRISSSKTKRDDKKPRPPPRPLSATQEVHYRAATVSL